MHILSIMLPVCVCVVRTRTHFIECNTHPEWPDIEMQVQHMCCIALCCVWKTPSRGTHQLECAKCAYIIANLPFLCTSTAHMEILWHMHIDARIQMIHTRGLLDSRHG